MESDTKCGQRRLPMRGTSVMCLAVLAATTGCLADQSLAVGDSIVIAVAPDDPYVAPHTSSDATGGGCGIGSPQVSIVARAADGSLASGGTIQLWLDPALDSKLADSVVSLKGGTASTCFVPGTDSGSVTIHAQSGLVSATKTITVRSRSLPEGSKLSITVEKGSVEKPVQIDNQTCSLNASHCAAALPRSAALFFTVDNSSAKQPPPSAVTLLVAVTSGWLASAPCSAGDTTQAEQSSLALQLADGIHGTLNWCFGPEAAVAVVTASSGPATAAATVTVVGSPANIYLSIHGSPASNGKRTVTLVALVQDCQSQPLPGRTVEFSVDAGNFDPGTTPMVVVSDASGLATATGLADSATFTVTASLAGQPGPSCMKKLEAQQ